MIFYVIIISFISTTVKIVCELRVRVFGPLARNRLQGGRNAGGINSPLRCLLHDYQLIDQTGQILTAQLATFKTHDSQGCLRLFIGSVIFCIQGPGRLDGSSKIELSLLGALIFGFLLLEQRIKIKLKRFICIGLWSKKRNQRNGLIISLCSL